MNSGSVPEAAEHTGGSREPGAGRRPTGSGLRAGVNGPPGAPGGQPGQPRSSFRAATAPSSATLMAPSLIPYVLGAFFDFKPLPRRGVREGWSRFVGFVAEVRAVSRWLRCR